MLIFESITRLIITVNYICGETCYYDLFFLPSFFLISSYARVCVRVRVRVRVCVRVCTHAPENQRPMSSA